MKGPWAAVPVRSVDRATAFAAIEMDNLWSGIARSLFLSTAFCARDGSGNRLRLSRVQRARNRDEALTYAIRRCRRSRYRAGSSGPWQWYDEPLWWNPSTLLAALDELGASNHATVSAAVSMSPGVFDHLHRFRNFYAHRGESTRTGLVASIRALHFPTSFTATKVLTSRALVGGRIRPQALILDWIADMRTTIRFLV